jgi:hypothetical protein
MTLDFHAGNRSLQERFDTTRLAAGVESGAVRPSLRDKDGEYMAARDMFFLATADEEGRPQVSYKGGDPGFVRMLDATTVAFPNYDGNGMYLSMGNVLVNPHVGMLFVDFEGQTRMRVNGDASIDLDDPLTAEWPEAQFIVRVQVREVFPNCPRYIHKYRKEEASRFVPRANVETPMPDWKRTMDREILPQSDQERLEAVDSAGAGSDSGEDRGKGKGE